MNPRMICAKFGWKWPNEYWEKVLRIFQSYPWFCFSELHLLKKYCVVFHWKNLLRVWVKFTNGHGIEYLVKSSKCVLLFFFNLSSDKARLFLLMAQNTKIPCTKRSFLPSLIEIFLMPMEENTKWENFGQIDGRTDKQTDRQTDSQTTDGMRTENSGELRVIVLINLT